MPRFKHILICTDFSPASEHAVRDGCELANALDSTLTLLHVSTPLSEAQFADMLGSADDGRDGPPDIDEGIRAAVDALREERLGSRPSVRAEVVRADSATAAICDYAREHAVDLIVVGSHGRTGLQHLLVGSVAEKVVRHAPCAVHVTRPRAES